MSIKIWARAAMMLAAVLVLMAPGHASAQETGPAREALVLLDGFEGTAARAGACVTKLSGVLGREGVRRVSAAPNQRTLVAALLDARGVSPKSEADTPSEGCTWANCCGRWGCWTRCRCW